MRILMVGQATFEEMKGGSARYLSGAAAAYRELGHDVRIVTAARYVATSGYSQRGVLGQARRSLVRLFVVIPRMAVAVIGFRPDVVNVHFALDGIGAVAMAGLTRTPVVVNFQGPWALEALATGRRGAWPLTTRMRRCIEGLVYRRAARCIVLSRAFRDLLATEYGVERSRIRVVPPGIEIDRFPFSGDPVGRRLRRGLGRERLVLSVRRLVPRMGLDLAVEAMALLVGRVDARLEIVGSGPEHERLEALARRLGLGARVRLLGRVPDDELPDLYGCADLCIVPSRSLEGFGYVALEALAAGTPVVAVATGGLVDLLEPLEPRWLVEASPEALAERMLDLLENAGQYPSRERCRSHAESFTWGRVAPTLIGVLTEARR